MKKIFVFALGLLLSVNFAFAEVVEVEYNKSPRDYSSAGNKTYKVKVTKEQLEARESAKQAYSSSASMSVNIVPLFDSWTTKQAQAKINNIGTKLLLANNLDDFVRFSVSRKEVVNATAGYNGVIQVYRGLLDYVETEDELAYVLGHELGHIYKKDSRTKLIRRGVEIGALATGIVLASAGSGGARKTGTGLIIAGGGGALAEGKLTKIQEARADISGIDFMVKAGYNPLAAISMMNKILNRNWDIISDHPSGDKRMIAAYNYIQMKYPKYIEGGYDTISYQRALQYIMKRKSQYSIKQTNIKNSKKNKNDVEADKI
ncbi:M48 family metallopeptidase [bacterium]|nr:M48 family metallopeptidase [bacterium]